MFDDNAACPIAGAMPRRQLLAQRAEQLLRGRLPDSVTIRDLCEAIGVSRRSLHLGFRESFGVPPKQYLKRLRLSGARHDLRHAGPGTLVTDVAVRWNFFHLGRFATEYARLFGESPSTTLNVRGTLFRKSLSGSPAGKWRSDQATMPP